MVNKALKVAKEKNLPDGIIDFFIGDDEETTTANLAKFEEVYSNGVQDAVDKKFKDSGRKLPGQSGSGEGADYGKQLAKDFAENNKGLEDAQKSYFDKKEMTDEIRALSCLRTTQRRCYRPSTIG
ncbi:DUF4355 domain-containing protein [Bacillus capparidis]|uniref:DUF4355 domain-containing protein n=1 Tax=Bacillus capparidis TaxID=1840411 RepID=UPI0028A7C199|nr:DUF4355 domain-containing protein [Bacillus capparidis]MED1095096.1 DUF4355 domain-containing protein [Bacillus capparidis]